jgi:SAM-dependent methyltransferase
MDIKKLYETKYACAEAQRFDEYERNRLLARHAPRFCKAGMRALDLGCRDGVIASYFQRLGLSVAGMDISEKALALARERGIKDLTQGDLEKIPLPYEDSTFDIVFWGDNVEHLFEPAKVLHDLKRILKRGGVLLISVPNMGCIWYRLYYLYHGMIIRTESPDSPSWEWSHIRFFNKRSMAAFLDAGGFEMSHFWGCSSNAVLDAGARIWPSFFGGIMLVCATRK